MWTRSTPLGLRLPVWKLASASAIAHDLYVGVYHGGDVVPPQQQVRAALACTDHSDCHPQRCQQRECRHPGARQPDVFHSLVHAHSFRSRQYSTAATSCSTHNPPSSASISICAMKG